MLVRRFKSTSRLQHLNSSASTTASQDVASSVTTSSTITRSSPLPSPSAIFDSKPSLVSSPDSSLRRSSHEPRHESPIAAFKRRLARKASFATFRAKRKHSKDASTTTKDLCNGGPQARKDQACQPTPGTLLPTDQVRKISPRTSTLSPSDFEPLLSSVKKEQIRRISQKGYLHKAESANHIFIKMASDAAQPPVSYSRLQEITTSACEKALGSVTAYSHASTEDWNTTIINTILGTLVQESTPASSDGQGQPPFKFVVNSTIIQHAPISSGSSTDPAVTGRRGMHAASGAFWNNEKDGMWSYKYSAAENKGLDVVIGIIWVWVG